MKPIFNDDAKYPNFFCADNYVDTGSISFVIHTAFPRVIIYLNDESDGGDASYEEFVKGATPYWQDTPNSDTQREEMMITAHNFLRDHYKMLFSTLINDWGNPQLAKDLRNLREKEKEKEKEDNAKEEDNQE